MNVQLKSFITTTSSTSPATERNVYPYELVNPGSKADNVLAIVDSVVHAPLPKNYTEIDNVVRERESNPRYASALTRARQRLAAQAEGDEQITTVASLRLRVGLSQAKVAAMLGGTQSSYSQIESGRRPDILLSTFEKLIEIFHVTRDELVISLKNTQEKK